MKPDTTIIRELLEDIKAGRVKVRSDKESIVELLEKYITILNEEQKRIEEEIKEWEKELDL